jgi:chromosome segregation ATPase
LSLGTTARGDDGVIVARHELASSSTRGGRPSYTHRQLSDRRSLKPTPSAQIRILKTQVDIKKETLKNYKEHLMKLQNHNHLLMSTIQSQENHTHNSVSRSLDKYHKFKGVLSIIKQRGTSDIRERRCELQELTRATQQEIQKLNDELNKKQKEINKNTNQMQKLLNYKEKEYPMKLVQIDQLKLQVDYLDDLHQVCLNG